MGDPHRRVGGVDALPARTRRTEDVDPQFLVVDLDVIGLFDGRGHLDPRERRLAAVLVVEGADPHQPVDAVLAAQRPVGVRRLDLERGGLQTRLLRLGGVEHLGAVAVPFGPPQVHAQQHRRPVGGVHATGTGGKLNDRIPLVVFTGQQRTNLERGDVTSELGKAHSGLGQQVLIGEVESGDDVVEAPPQRFDPGDVPTHRREPAGDALRPGLVAPQVRIRCLTLQVRGAASETFKIKNCFDACERRVESLDLLCEVGGHETHLTVGNAPPPPGCRSWRGEAGTHVGVLDSEFAQRDPEHIQQALATEAPDRPTDYLDCQRALRPDGLFGRKAVTAECHPGHLRPISRW